jgi:hypothetical protein
MPRMQCACQAFSKTNNHDKATMVNLETLEPKGHFDMRRPIEVGHENRFDDFGTGRRASSGNRADIMCDIAI